jgi:polyisoprenoid-binding protein YceI
LIKSPLIAHMKRSSLLLFALFFTTAFTFAQSTISHSSVAFKIKNLGIYTSGTIGGLQATIHFDAANLPSSAITASVDLNTINSDNSLRDDHLKSDEFFDIAHYPKVSLKSVSLAHKSGNKYTGQFSLTIKNKTKTIEIPFTYTLKGDVQVFSGSFKINRLDFGLGDSSLTLSDEVIIDIEAEVKN